MKTKILNLAKKLIAIESIKSRQEKLEQIVAVAANYFQGTNLIVKQYQSNHKPSLMVLTKKTKHLKLILNGHLDVVEAEPSQFKLKIHGNNAIGRGVFDMKGYAAIMMAALKTLSQEQVKLSVGLMLTTDEEIGGQNGVRYLLKKERYSADVAYIPDGGDNYDILTEEKGILHLKVTATGKAVHASKPWLGENALDKLVNFYHQLRSLYVNPKNESQWKISMNLGKIQGGEAPNKVPDYGEMYLDFRFPAPETVKGMFHQVEKYAQDLDLQITTSGEAFQIEKDNPFLQKYSQIAEGCLKRPITFKRYPAASDARFFSDYKIPVIMTRGKGGGQHSRDEWADINDYLTSYEIVLKFIKEVAKE